MASIISAETHPRLYALIAHLEVCNNRPDPLPPEISVHEWNVNRCRIAEAELDEAGDLTDEQRDTICDGEESEMLELVARLDIGFAHSALTLFFEGRL